MVANFVAVAMVKEMTYGGQGGLVMMMVVIIGIAVVPIWKKN